MEISILLPSLRKSTYGKKLSAELNKVIYILDQGSQPSWHGVGSVILPPTPGDIDNT